MATPDTGTWQTYEFEGFRLDRAERLLLRDHVAVPLTPKAFDLLVCFLERPGSLLDKSTLLASLWPDTIVEEANLAFQVSTLRKVLDAGRRESMIQTVPTRGYRFVATVRTVRGEPTAAVRAGSVPFDSHPQVPARRRPSRSVLALLTVSSLIALTAIAVVLIRRQPDRESSVPAEPALTRLTANPPGDPVAAARISPDGRLLAYTDNAGVHVQFIESGETRLIPDTRGLAVYAWSSDSERVRAASCDGTQCAGWDLSIVGTDRHRNGATWSIADEVSTTPDGTRLLRTSDHRTVTADLLNGMAPRVVVRSEKEVWAQGWSLDREHILYVAEGQSIVRSVGLEGGPLVTLFTAGDGQGIEDVLELPGRRLLLALRRATTGGVRSNAEFSIQEVELGPDGHARGASRIIAPWRREWLSGLTASADGRRIGFTSGATERRIYTSGFDTLLNLQGQPERLTAGEWEEATSAWTPDGRSVLFYSLRNDEGDIFRQAPGSSSAEPIVTGPGAQYRPEPTSDGRWLLYAEEMQFARRPIIPQDKGIGQQSRIMRVPVNGGTPATIASLPGWGIPRCSFRGRCVVEEMRGEDLVASELDPLRGIGNELGRWKSSYAGFCLLPDGNEAVNIVRDAAGIYRVLRVDSFDGRPPREVPIPGVGALTNLDPVPDGVHFFSSTQAPIGRSSLVIVGLDGTARVLWAPERMDAEFAVVSRDGTRVAMSGAAPHRNVELATIAPR